MRIVSYLAAGVVFVMSSAVPAAAQFVFACPATCNVDCQLVTDIICDAPGEGVILNNGADLDMKGFDISCTGPSSCGTAVTMTAASSMVKNTGLGEPRIAGYFGVGVDCASKSSSRVEGIRFELADDLAGVSQIDISNCAKVEHNVLIGGDKGIETSGIANNDLIADNYVADFSTGIRVTGGKNVTVDHNLLVSRAATFGAVGIYLDMATGAPAVTNNIVMGDDGIPIAQTGSPSATYTQNFCDPTMPAGPFCTAPVVPFTLP